MHYYPRKYPLAAVALSTMTFAACSGESEPIGTHVESLEVVSFHAVLSGADEVPANDSKARGTALVDTSIEGQLSYKLIVANIDDVRAAHIHCGAPGINAPIGVTLFAGGPVTINGILAEATVTAPDANNTCGWLTIADVVAAIESGNTYVNAHTVVFPRGEIRGQLK
jgi:hypothetical protein